MTTDADVIDALSAGLEGPVAFLGSTFFVMRISGTGCAWRAAKGEFAFRDPRLWLTDDMAGRWAGAPCLVLHPASGVVDGESLASQIVGTVVRAFIRDAELMGVVRVIDADAATSLIKFGADTSPSVVFEETDAEPIELSDGSRVLIEGNPKLIDHLAIVERGVWSKGTDARGVETTKVEA